MIDITTLTPIVVGTGLSFCFKSTRPFGILGVALLSYFYPILLLIGAAVAGLGYLYWKRRQR